MPRVDQKRRMMDGRPAPWDARRTEGDRSVGGRCEEDVVPWEGSHVASRELMVVPETPCGSGQKMVVAEVGHGEKAVELHQVDNQMIPPLVHNFPAVVVVEVVGDADGGALPPEENHHVDVVEDRPGDVVEVVHDYLVKHWVGGTADDGLMTRMDKDGGQVVATERVDVDEGATAPVLVEAHVFLALLSPQL